MWAWLRCAEQCCWWCQEQRWEVKGCRKRHSFSWSFPTSPATWSSTWLLKYQTEPSWSQTEPEEDQVSPILCLLKQLQHLPYIYFEFGVILRHVFFDQAVRSFLGLAQAGEGQWQDVLQLHLLLCARSRSAFLKHTDFYASAGPKTLSFWTSNAHVGRSAPDTGCRAGNSGAVRQLFNNLKSFAA